MELESIIKLIKAVSESSVTNFEFEEENIKLVLEKNIATQMISAAPASIQQQIAEQSVCSQSINEDKKIVKSILVGVFYSASGPEEAPFVKIGDTVKRGQIIGIIEAMKLMNEIECDCDGIVEEILVNDGDMVEYGQPLFRIKEV
ncbi:acetyl-CoA carboxylase biotin carboxyl carrier protein [Lachnotalea glycerini]|uniref:Biotin carboxyl carrier protein of acetyl-CoA carboxylase n=1 Tax=Lachnotalea glycerini TaxID=1763509 RepID=A0A318F2Y0_9FIRM|nr:acetyl-CoA carboxylase biotin carboxyl carrier protein [Lachnotalea glycerini]OYO88643.1 acetyl-CoA carboxylase, biotin carboxyl carrier protein [Lachnotalea glycerini]PXV96228.1 acetyl-CoA carboxylase biotin carboxyl carrier protein [Lachnotalea glycerini]